MSWTCQYCGKDTSNVEYDYLLNTDHISCILQNNKVKTKLKIENPHHINCKNYLQDGSTIEIFFTGWEDRINASDNKPYTIYKFQGVRNNKMSGLVQFELHTTIIADRLQMNIWRGSNMSVGSVYVDTIKNKDELRNYMIDEVKRY
jgi:hypothetical protein